MILCTKNAEFGRKVGVSAALLSFTRRPLLASMELKLTVFVSDISCCDDNFYMSGIFV